MTAFDEMGIMPEISKAVEEMEWTLPTDIQSEAIPLILGGGDVLMAAETGSGKTGAFCLPILQIVWETINEKKHPKSKTKSVSDEWVLSYDDRHENLSLSNDGLSAQSRNANQWQGCRTNRGVKKDRSSKSNMFYYEVHFTESGLARIGWALNNAVLDLGTDKNGWGYGGTAKKSNARNFEDYGETFGEKFDIIGNIIDLDSGEISWLKNGKHLGKAFQLMRPLVEQSLFFPAICVKNAGITVKFKPDNDAHPVPYGCEWVSKASKLQIGLNPNIGSSTSHAVDNGPKAVILEPSRELAEQTYDCIKKFNRYLSGQMRQLLIIGGANAKEQMEQLNSGVDIVVATPGRIDDLVNGGHLSLKSCRFFVLDEVDGLLQQGHLNLITRIHALIPRMFSDGKRLQVIVCSATLHNFDVKKLAEKLMYFPTWVDLKGEDSIPETVHHVVFHIDPRKDLLWKSLKGHIRTDDVHVNDKMNYQQPNVETLSESVKLLKGEYVVKAIDTFKMDQGIIFCRTKLDCDNLEAYFNHIGGGNRNPKNPYSCVCLHGDRNPQERKENLELFKKKQCKFLICTDVAARGIDISGVPFVIQITLPDEKANYLHRTGRVGRADRMGLAISLVACVPEKVWFHSNCNNRGKGCHNTNLTETGGCCIWYNEMNILAEIEDHLNYTIQQIGSDFKLEVNEFDGKVVYGAKKTGTGHVYENHVKQLTNVVKELTSLETMAQNNYLKFYSLKNII